MSSFLGLSSCNLRTHVLCEDMPKHWNRPLRQETPSHYDKIRLIKLQAVPLLIHTQKNIEEDYPDLGLHLDPEWSVALFWHPSPCKQTTSNLYPNLNLLESLIHVTECNLRTLGFVAVNIASWSARCKMMYDELIWMACVVQRSTSVESDTEWTRKCFGKHQW